MYVNSKPDELIVRVDAVALWPCNSHKTSDRCGGVSVTVISTGQSLADKVSVGERFAGPMSSGLRSTDDISRSVRIDADQFAHLRRSAPDSGYAEAAVDAALSSVDASYRLYRRHSLKPDGFALFVGTAARSSYKFPPEMRPRKAILAGVGESVDRSLLLGAELIEINPIAGPELRALSQERTGARGFDDIIVFGRTEPGLLDALRMRLAAGGLLNIVSGSLPVAGWMNCCSRTFEVCCADVADGYDMFARGALFIDATDRKISDIGSDRLQSMELICRIGGLGASSCSSSSCGIDVIYPQIEGLSIMPIPKLAQAMPVVSEKLRCGKFWSKDAEDALLGYHLEVELP